MDTIEYAGYRSGVQLRVRARGWFLCILCIQPVRPRSTAVALLPTPPSPAIARPPRYHRSTRVPNGQNFLKLAVFFTEYRLAPDGPLRMGQLDGFRCADLAQNLKDLGVQHSGTLTELKLRLIRLSECDSSRVDDDAECFSERARLRIRSNDNAYHVGLLELRGGIITFTFDATGKQLSLECSNLTEATQSTGQKSEKGGMRSPQLKLVFGKDTYIVCFTVSACSSDTTKVKGFKLQQHFIDALGAGGLFPDAVADVGDTRAGEGTSSEASPGFSATSTKPLAVHSPEP